VFALPLLAVAVRTGSLRAAAAAAPLAVRGVGSAVSLHGDLRVRAG